MTPRSLPANGHTHRGLAMRSVRVSLLRQRTRRGFSLLEVILAVALTAVVVAMVAAAIDFHLGQLTVRRAKIEEAQLARAVLRRIADDLRGAIVYRPIDFSSAQALTQGLDGLLGDGGGDEDGEGGEADPTEDEAAQGTR